MLVCMASSCTLIELSEEEDLAVRLMAAVNLQSTSMTGDGLDKRREDPVCSVTDENRKIFSLVTQDQARSWIPVLELCPSV
jgi:hypothetical protein